MSNFVNDLMADVKAKNPNEPEFHQAVQEVAESVALVYERYPEYRAAKIFERIIEPERLIMFRAAWTDDQGVVQINRGFRIQDRKSVV
jgi:glutamate dehydrogenase (NADP+)